MCCQRALKGFCSTLWDTWDTGDVFRLAGYSAGCGLAWGNANTPGLHSQVWRGSGQGLYGMYSVYIQYRVIGMGIR